MPDPAQFVKAELEIEGGAPIPVLFNPTEFSITKSNNWKYDKVTGQRRSRRPQFGGGNPRELHAQPAARRLAAPKAAARPGHHRQAVQDDGGQRGPDGRRRRGAVPPFVTFQWGARSTVQVGLHVADRRLPALPAQRRPDPRRRQDRRSSRPRRPARRSANGANRAGNPTTRANAGHGVHTVKDGDSLPSIAYHAYGDADRLARDRRGQRDRQPAAPAPRQRPARLPKLDG